MFNIDNHEKDILAVNYRKNNSNKRLLALVIYFKNRKKCKENVQSVELCNIYNYKQLYLY